MMETTLSNHTIILLRVIRTMASYLAGFPTCILTVDLAHGLTFILTLYLAHLLNSSCCNNYFQPIMFIMVKLAVIC